MDYRKLIKFGNSSHIISLPNNWVKKNKLKKGDLVYFEENGNGELILNHEIKKESNLPREITVNILNKEITTIQREIMNAYINNYDIINIVGDLKRCRKDVEETLNNLLAVEIMEQTSNKIVAKDFLDLSEVSIIDNIRRIDLTIRSMINDLKESLQSNIDNYDNISRLDNNVNKIRFLLYRAINKCMKTNSLEIYSNIKSFNELMNYRLIINNLEDIADECKRISRFLRNLKLKKNEKNEIERVYFKIEESYLNVMKACFTNNKELAHEVASKKDEIIENCRNLFKKFDSKNIGVILEKLKGTESFIRNIARIIIDNENINEKNK